MGRGDWESPHPHIKFLTLYLHIYTGRNPVVGAVGEMANMKRHNCGRRGRIGCVAPAVPSSLG